MQLGKYEIIEELGRGGFGIVYKAHDTVLNVDRALKVLHPALVTDETFLERFKHEAQYAARLEHPNLVPVYDFAEAEGRYFLAMKYMPGKSLKDLLKEKGKLGEKEALCIFEQVCAGVAYAHRQGVIHRDLKPGNILMDEDGSARVSDMGFAKAIAGGSSVTLSATGAMIGTPSYMAPEMWHGKPATQAADQYSLACILVEMLTGQVLFDGETTPTVMLKHFEALQLPEELPASLRSVLTKALDKQPEKRYTSIEDFQQAVDACIQKTQDLPSKASPLQTKEPKPDEHHTQPEMTGSSSNTNTSAWQQGYSKLHQQEIRIPVSSGQTDSKPSYKPPVINYPYDLRDKKILPSWQVWLLAGLALSLCLFLLIASGTLSDWFSRKPSSNPIIYTPKHTQTATYDLTSTARASSTAQARLTQTAVAQRTQTAIAQRTATARSAFDLFEMQRQSSPLVFFEQENSLIHKEDKTVKNFHTGKLLKNFLVEVTFFNPYDTSVAGWDYGIFFRHNGGADQYRLYLSSSGEWVFQNWEDTKKWSQNGPADLNMEQGEINTLGFLAIDDEGYLFINDRYVTILDLSERKDSGYIKIGTGFVSGHEVEGYATDFADLRIYSLDSGQIDNTATAAPGQTNCDALFSGIAKNSHSFTKGYTGYSSTRYDYDAVFSNEQPWDPGPYTLTIESDDNYCDFYRPGECSFSTYEGEEYLRCTITDWIGWSKYGGDSRYCSLNIVLSHESCGPVYSYWYDFTFTR